MCSCYLEHCLKSWRTKQNNSKHASTGFCSNKLYHFVFFYVTEEVKEAPSLKLYWVILSRFLSHYCILLIRHRSLCRFLWIKHHKAYLACVPVLVFCCCHHPTTQSSCTLTFSITNILLTSYISWSISYIKQFQNLGDMTWYRSGCWISQSS